jgi:hypothetical protein
LSPQTEIEMFFSISNEEKEENDDLAVVNSFCSSEVSLFHLCSL